MSHVIRKSVFGISEHQETSKICVKYFFLHTRKSIPIFSEISTMLISIFIVNLYKIRFVDHWVGSKGT